MIGLLATALGLGGKFLSHVVGGHVLSPALKLITGKGLAGVAIPAANAVADGLGLRGAIGLVAGLYLGNEGFRAGVNQAVKALLP